MALESHFSVPMLHSVMLHCFRRVLIHPHRRLVGVIKPAVVLGFPLGGLDLSVTHFYKAKPSMGESAVIKFSKIFELM
ncbi:hypothetical protein B8W72_30065 [Pseudomonas putida]|uniref:Uncharacterized protein n=1 Tax=Pseudomonas putida TaxID=303 RepID=A0A1Y3KA35_PSEPU|nr:hypothetical protein B8W72_30065 [Pseudomonas putida]